MDRPRPGDPAALTGNDARSDRGDPACDGRLSATTAGRSATVDGKSPSRSEGPDASRLRLVDGKSEARSGKSKPKSSGISGHDGIDGRTAATAALPIRGARSSADTIGRSDSCKEPSAAGKSEGRSVRSCGGAGSRNDVVGARQHNLKNVSVSSRAARSSSSRGPAGRASRRSRSTPSTPRGSGGTSSRSAPTRASSSSSSPSPTSSASTGSAPPSPSSSGPSRSRRARPWARSPRWPTTCAYSTRAWASRTAPAAASASRRRRCSRSSTGPRACPRGRAQRARAHRAGTQRGAQARARAPAARGVRARADRRSVVDLGDEIASIGRSARPRRRGRSPRAEGRHQGPPHRQRRARAQARRGRLLVQPGDEEPFWMSERFACVDCGISLPPIEPRMFSFNGPHGACPACDGLGARDVVDPERCVGDPRTPCAKGVVLAWGRRGSVALATGVARAVEVLGCQSRRGLVEAPGGSAKAILLGTAALAVARKNGRGDGHLAWPRASKKRRRPAQRVRGRRSATPAAPR
jgi:hypothetical protein